MLTFAHFSPQTYQLSFALKDPIHGVLGSATAAAGTTTPSAPHARPRKPFNPSAFTKGPRSVPGDAILDWIIAHKALHASSRADAAKIAQQLLDDFVIRSQAGMQGSAEDLFHDDGTMYWFVRENLAASSFIDTLIKVRKEGRYFWEGYYGLLWVY